MIRRYLLELVHDLCGRLSTAVQPLVEHAEAPRLDTKKIDAVLSQFEGDYFLDYAVFTGTIREYISAALEEQFNREPNDLHRRAYTLGIYREEYTAYEDLGAFIDGFLEVGKNPRAIPLGRMIRYAPGNVKLDRMLEGRGIKSGEQLYDRLRLHDWIPTDWQFHFPTIDLEKALRRACWFIVDDCARSQKHEGISAFNKIKHGLLMIANGKRLIRAHPEGPAVLYVTDPRSSSAGMRPVTLLTITMSDDKIEERRKQIFFVQATLRILAVLYVLKRYPDVPAKRGLSKGPALLKLPDFAAITKLLDDLSNKPWQKQTPGL